MDDRAQSDAAGAPDDLVREALLSVVRAARLSLEAVEAVLGQPGGVAAVTRLVADLVHAVVEPLVADGETTASPTATSPTATTPTATTPTATTPTDGEGT